MKSLIVFLCVTFLKTNCFVFAQDEQNKSNKEATVNFPVRKNLIKTLVFYVGIPGPYIFTLGFERIIKKNSFDLILSSWGAIADNYSNVLSLHTGYKYYFNNGNFNRSRFYATLLFRYEKTHIYLEQDAQGTYKTKGYGIGGGLGGILVIKKWLFIEPGLLGFYSYRGKEKYSWNTTKSVLNSGFRILPRFLLGIIF